MEELEEIKKAVLNKPLYEPLGYDSEPAVVPKHIPIRGIDISQPVEKKEVREVVCNSISETSKMAPIFVRVDKFREVLEHIQDLRSTINNLEGALAIRKSVHKVNAEADEVIEKTLEKFSASLELFGKEIVAQNEPEGIESKETVDGTISQLGDEILKLKSELEKMKL